MAADRRYFTLTSLDDMRNFAACVIKLSSCLRRVRSSSAAPVLAPRARGGPCSSRDRTAPLASKKIPAMSQCARQFTTSAKVILPAPGLARYCASCRSRLVGMALLAAGAN